MAWQARIPRRGFCCALLGTAVAGGAARAQGAGVTTEVLARGRTDYSEALDGPAEVVTVRAALDPGASLGWHLHPGPVTAVITRGELSMYDSSSCKTLYVAGDAAFVQRGLVHFERNEGADALEFVATFVVPPGSPLRIEAPASLGICPPGR